MSTAWKMNFGFELCQPFVTISVQMPDEIKLVEKSRIMDATRIKRALSRLASEIVEENHGAKDLYLVGIRRRGVPLAEPGTRASLAARDAGQFDS